MIKMLRTTLHSDWVKHCQNNKQKHPFKLGEKDQYFVSHNKQSNISAKLQMVKQLFTTDVGQHQMWAAQFYPFKNHGQWVTSGGFRNNGVRYSFVNWCQIS